MKFIIMFEDEPTANPDIRKVLMAEHLSFLEAHSEKVLSAGPLSDTGGRGRGGLWLVDVASVDEVEQLVHERPVLADRPSEVLFHP